MKASRVTAVGMVAAAVLWIASGHLMPRDSAEGEAAIRASEAKAQPLFRVAVATAKVESACADADLVRPHRSRPQSRDHRAHRRHADRAARQARPACRRRARSSPFCPTTRVKAQVAQAEALVEQRKAELDAKRTLIASGALAEARSWSISSRNTKRRRPRWALARAELERSIVRAPWAGVITDVPAEVGGAAFSMAGKEIATLVALDPMLAVVEVSERKLAGIKVGETARGQADHRPDACPAACVTFPNRRARPRAPIASKSR